MNKKANAIMDSAMILAMLFSIVLTVIILKINVLDPINTDIQADDDFSTQAKAISADSSGGFGTFWDTAIVLVLVFLWAAALISSQFINTQPVFFAFSVFGLIILLIVAMSIEQSYEDTIGDSEYSGVELEYPKVHFLMSNIVAVIMIIALTVMIALYAKG